MGKPAIRLGADKSTGHQGFSPVVAVAASGNVFINGKGSVRTGDPYQPHSAPKKPPHVGRAIGRGKVRVNGKQAQRAGDPNTCQDTASNGSKNVRFG
ncbi:putative baseplate puncturing device [Erwinia phage pEa_SNUABM_5]|uniref:Putative baseplate puncturing device n=1 Tax=Erwinia phage pEa_SNUABM_5 TaxID=2797313 RepID=A0A7T8IVM1_9CAUD|nr:putative baseplate puncturing device [Erwinia phage pEa_SNUABM_5]QQO90255.1 putative baseplate puncturing device [Erwinia phage pEa_SNUABM_5]